MFVAGIASALCSLNVDGGCTVHDRVNGKALYHQGLHEQLYLGLEPESIKPDENPAQWAIGDIEKWSTPQGIGVLFERLRQQQAKTGEVVVSLMWDCTDDLDLYVVAPDGTEIHNGNAMSADGGVLDVGNTGAPVENIYWESAADGDYTVHVRQVAIRQGQADVPYTVAVQIGDKLETFTRIFEFNNWMRVKHKVAVFKFPPKDPPCKSLPEFEVLTLPQMTVTIASESSGSFLRPPPVKGWGIYTGMVVEPILDSVTGHSTGCADVEERCLGGMCEEMPHQLLMPMESGDAGCTLSRGGCEGLPHPSCKETGHGAKLSARPRFNNGTTRVANVSIAINQSPSNYTRPDPIDPGTSDEPNLLRFEKDVCTTSLNLARSPVSVTTWENRPEGMEISLWSANLTQGLLHISRPQCDKYADVFCEDGFEWNPQPRTDTHDKPSLSWCIPRVRYNFVNESDHLFDGECKEPTEWAGIPLGTAAADVVQPPKTEAGVEAIERLGREPMCVAPPLPVEEECGTVKAVWQCWETQHYCTDEERVVAEAVDSLQGAPFSKFECEQAGGIYYPLGPPLTEADCLLASGLFFPARCDTFGVFCNILSEN